MAAVLASGTAAALSYRSAAHHIGIRRTDRTLIEVTASRGRRPQSGIQLHYDPLAPDEITVHEGIPVTTCARTLLDLASVLDRHRLERAIIQAEVLEIFNAGAIALLLDRHPRHRGASLLRAALDANPQGITRSDLEDLFVDFRHRYCLPIPELNASIWLGDRWIEVDCLWRPQRVIVELDSHTFHGTGTSFESDRARDRELQARGWRVIRVTWRQLHQEADSLAADLCRLLA
jgi:hypothetical protein